MRNMSSRIFSLCCALIVAVAILYEAPLGAEQPSARDLVLTGEFRRVNRVEAMPLEVVAAVEKALGGQPLANMPHLAKAGTSAAPGAPQLLMAGDSGSVWFVHYRVEEDETTYHLLVVTVGEKGQAQVAGHLRLHERAWSVPSLKHIIRRGAFEAAG